MGWDCVHHLALGKLYVHSEAYVGGINFISMLGMFKLQRRITIHVWIDCSINIV